MVTLEGNGLMREAFGLDKAAQVYLLARHRVAFGASELQKLCHEHAHLLVFMTDVCKPGVIAHLALEKLGVRLHHCDGCLELMPASEMKRRCAS